MYYLKKAQLLGEKKKSVLGLYQHCFRKSLTNGFRSSENPLKKSGHKKVTCAMNYIKLLHGQSALIYIDVVN